MLRRARSNADVRPRARGGEIRVRPTAGRRDAGSRRADVCPSCPAPWLAVAAEAREERLREWTDLLTQTVEPESWRDNGGIADVRANGLSLMTTTPQTHQDVADLLARVAAAAAGRDALAAPARRPPGRRMKFNVDALPLRQALARWQAAVAVNVLVDFGRWRTPG